jgi:hypothetical protein
MDGASDYSVLDLIVFYLQNKKYELEDFWNFFSL